MENELNILLEHALLGQLNKNELNYVLEASVSETREPQRVRSKKGLLNLESMADDDIMANFRFQRSHLAELQKFLGIPESIEVRQGCKISGIRALCVLLRRLAYPNRLIDLEPMFGLSSTYLSFIINYLVKFIEQKHNHLLNDLQSLQWFNEHKLKEYSQAIEKKGARLKNCWGFIDGTARRICRPTINQEEYYSGHKRFHCVKYQSVLAPDGIIVSLHGAFTGRRHDAGIYRDSTIYRQLERLSRSQSFVIYADPAYPISDVLICPYRGGRLTEAQENFNSKMSKVRQAVEWGFQKVVAEFAFIDFHKNQKLLLQEISAMYKVAVILTNCHTCLYGNQTAQYFDLEPPSLQEYLTP